jgi:Lar family restriction alleviation protein
MDKLKKCPFCGGEAELDLFYKTPLVQCKDCGVESAMYDNKQQAIDAWNKRVQ